MSLSRRSCEGLQFPRFLGSFVPALETEGIASLVVSMPGGSFQFPGSEFHGGRKFLRLMSAGASGRILQQRVPGTPDVPYSAVTLTLQWEQQLSHSFQHPIHPTAPIQGIWLPESARSLLREGASIQFCPITRPRLICDHPTTLKILTTMMLTSLGIFPPPTWRTVNAFSSLTSSGPHISHHNPHSSSLG